MTLSTYQQIWTRVRLHIKVPRILNFIGQIWGREISVRLLDVVLTTMSEPLLFSQGIAGVTWTFWWQNLDVGCRCSACSPNAVPPATTFFFHIQKAKRQTTLWQCHQALAIVHFLNPYCPTWGYSIRLLKTYFLEVKRKLCRADFSFDSSCYMASPNKKVHRQHPQ